VAHNWYADARGENEYGLSASGINSDSLNTSAYTRQGGRYGNGSLTVSDAWDRQDQRHTLSSSGNYSSTLALSRSGLWLGRWSDGRPASAVAVNVPRRKMLRILASPCRWITAAAPIFRQ
jgi:hypothetical protein